MLTSDYIVGLVDGEGSFTAYVRHQIQENVKRRVRIEPKFYVKLIEKDKSILDALKNFFKCGNVYFQKDNRKNHQDCYRFEVSNRQNLIDIIIPFFQRNPLRFPSKKKDFDLFCSLIDGIKKGLHLTQEGLEKLYLVKQKMH